MKYKLTDDRKIVNGKVLRRIVCVKAFGTVQEEDLGGFIESEKNLSQFGECWVRPNAIVMDNAIVDEDAIIKNYVQISGNACVCGNAKVGGNAQIFGNASVSGLTVIEGYTILNGSEYISAGYLNRKN